MGDKALVYGRLAQARGFSFFFSFPLRILQVASVLFCWGVPDRGQSGRRKRRRSLQGIKLGHRRCECNAGMKRSEGELTRRRSAGSTQCRRSPRAAGAKKKGVGRWVGRVVEPNLAGTLDRTRSSSQWRRQARCAQAVYLVEFAGRAVVVARQEHAAERVAEGLNQAEVPRHEGPRRRRLHQMQLVQCAAVQQEEEGERGGERPSPIIHHALARSNRWGERRKEKKKRKGELRALPALEHPWRPVLVPRAGRLLLLVLRRHGSPFLLTLSAAS